MTNTYAQLPAGQDWDYSQGDAVSMAVTIATDPVETLDLDAEPVTAGIVGSALPITVEVLDDPAQTVRLTPSTSLAPGQYGWWAKWRGRTFLAGQLNVRRADSHGASTPDDLTVTVDYVDYTVTATIQNGGIPGGEGTGSGVPAGGTTGQALVKSSNTDGDADWAAVANTVNGQSGTVVLDYGDVGAEPDGAVDAAMTAHTAAADPHPVYLLESAAATDYAPIARALPAGGTTGQVLAKDTSDDYAASWQDAAGGTGAVDSVNGQTGVVVLDIDDVAPDQTDEGGKVLGTDGTNATWTALPATPPTVVTFVYDDVGDTRPAGADTVFWIPDDPSLGDPTNATVDDVVFRSQSIEILEYAISDETTALTTGTAKLTVRAPFAFTLTGVRASLATASSSGVVTVDINEGDTPTSVLSTKLTIDASERTSVTAATAAVISDSAIADDAAITFDIDTAGTDAAGLKVKLYVVRVLP